MVSQQAKITTEKPKKNTSKWLLVGGGIFSVLWTAGYIFVASQTASCFEDDVTGGQEIISWWTSHVACLQLNEIGDSLAGFAAPLAFFWFLVAVFLQKEELENSREELRLSREAAEEQVRNQKEANATALHNLDTQYRLQWMAGWQNAYDDASSIIDYIINTNGAALNDNHLQNASRNYTFSSMLGDDHAASWFKRIGPDEKKVLIKNASLQRMHKELVSSVGFGTSDSFDKLDLAKKELDEALIFARRNRINLSSENILDHISKTHLSPPSKF
jgi:hypothetical protein